MAFSDEQSQAMAMSIMFNGTKAFLYPAALLFPEPDSGWLRTHWARRHFRINNADLYGWLLKRADQGSHLVVFFGGNGDNVGANYLGRFENEQSHSYLLVNYRGYGDSKGSPNEARLVHDAIEILRQVQEELRPSNTTIAGYSLGSGVAMQVAATLPPDKLVLLCPFDSINNVAENLIPDIPGLPRQFTHDHFDSAAHAPAIHCPVTILVGDKDELIPWQSTQRLIESFGREVEVLHFATGHSIFSHAKLMPALVRAFDAGISGH